MSNKDAGFLGMTIVAVLELVGIAYLLFVGCPTSS